MNHISRMQVFYSFEQLIHNILLVDVLQYMTSFYHVVQVGIYNVCTTFTSHIHTCNNWNLEPYTIIFTLSSKSMS